MAAAMWAAGIKPGCVGLELLGVAALGERSLDSLPTASVTVRMAECRFLMSCNCLWAQMMLIS